MNLIKKRIVFSGGKGRFGKTFQQIDNDYKIFYPLKSELDITKINTIRSYLKKTKPKYLFIVQLCPDQWKFITKILRKASI